MATAAQPAPASQPKVVMHDTEFRTKVPADPSDVTQQVRSPRKIAELAYTCWEARGGRDGSAEEDWFRAERELYGRSSDGDE